MPLSHRRSVIAASLFVAFLLNIAPWPLEYVWLRPDFLLLVTLYWVIYQPNYLNIGSAWLLGLLLDLSDGGRLGQHALAYAVTVFLLLLVQRRMYNFPPWQQALPVTALLLIEQSVCILVATFTGDTHYPIEYFAAIVTGAACWVPLWLTLHRLRTPDVPEAK